MFTNFAVFSDFATSATDMKMARHQFAIRYYNTYKQRIPLRGASDYFIPYPFCIGNFGIVFKNNYGSKKTETKKVNAFALT